MQNKVSKCVNPEQLIKVASSLGFKFSREDLRHIASDLYAEFFPWAGKGTEYRVNFFKDKSAVRKKSRHISEHLEETSRETLKIQRIKAFRVPQRLKTKVLTNALPIPPCKEDKAMIHEYFI